jgi:SAM-dependent methyltransferase
MADGREKERRQRDFWEKMAAGYPSPFAAKTLADTERVIALAEARGVEIDGAAILDIACGPGTYALPLARRAARVLGLDVSANMIRRFEALRDGHGLENASAVRCSWQDADLRALGLEKGFDIVWASMTPAVRGLADVRRMHRCARRWCVYVGWGGVRRNPLLERAFAAHALPFGPPPGAAALRAVLAREGIAVEIDPVRTAWDWEGGEEEAVEYVAGFIEFQGRKSPDMDKVRAVVGDFSEKGRVRHRTEVEMGVMVWPVP